MSIPCTCARAFQDMTFGFPSPHPHTGNSSPSQSGTSNLYHQPKRCLPFPLPPFNPATLPYLLQAIAALRKAGMVTHITSQNVDSLHLRSGVSRQGLAPHPISFLPPFRPTHTGNSSPSQGRTSDPHHQSQNIDSLYLRSGLPRPHSPSPPVLPPLSPPTHRQ